MELEEIKQYLDKGLDGVQAKQLAALAEQKTEWKKHYDELKAAGADSAEVKILADRAIKRLDALEAEWSRPDAHKFGEQKTVGELVAENESINELAKRSKPGGAGWVRGLAATMPIKSFMQFAEFAPFGQEFKTTITSSAVGSSTIGILTPQRLPGISKPGVRRIRVRDLMTRMTTTHNSVEYVKENAFTNAASPTAETISKPESALTFTIAQSNVKTIASWLPASRQILDDFGALAGYINQRLLEGLKDVEDYEIVAGDGTGQHLTGLSTSATAYDTARNVTGDTYIDKINHGISQIEDVLQVADGIILHPRDWRAIQLIKTEEGGANRGMYLMGGPKGDAVPTLWGLPVATTTAVSRGTFYVGAFEMYCVIADRMDARIDISTEHYDYFVRNMVAIRAEERMTFFQTRADAVVYGSF